MPKPWAEIENEYITTNIGQRALAEKYGVSLSALNMNSKSGNWVQKRAAFVNGTLESLEEKEVEIFPGDGYFVLELPPDAEDMKPRQRYQLYSSLVKKIPKIDTNDPIQVKNRIESYFDCCNKNDIATSPPDLARWLKTSKRNLMRWLNGEFRKTTHQPLIEDAWTKLESDLVNRIQVGAISPPSGIFLLKNWFNYKDVQDIVVAPKNPLGELQDKKALEERIMGTVVVEEEEQSKRIEGAVVDVDFSVVEEGAQDGHNKPRDNRETD